MKNFRKISLGEGNTPLLKLNNLSKKLGLELWAKCEFLNPTGSFKDRGSVAEISKSLELGKKGVVCASTGNMAASLAAYSAKTNLECIVVVPEKTPESKLTQALVCGATLKKIKGTYDDCVRVAENISQEKNYLLCGDYDIRRLGQTNIGIELAASGVKLDGFVVPVGNGTVGCAVAEGLAMNGKFPKFIGVQGTGADPIYKAWRDGTEIETIENPRTIASAMNVGKPLDGKLTLEWVNRTNGAMLSVTDKEIREAKKLLAQSEGIYVEGASAATVAGLAKLAKIKNQSLVLILTGSGLKEG